jgi:hypothetical protein
LTSDRKNMARPFEQIATDRLQIREGGGCMAAFGLPFFAAGVFILASVAGIIPLSNDSEMRGWGRVAMAFMGLVFTAVGGTLAFGRVWTTLDVTRRLISKQWGLVVPLRERTYPLTGYSAVTLGFVRGDSDSADKFPIGLKAQNGPGLPLCSFNTYASSRECAIAVAPHLHLDVEESTTDHPVRATPADAERALRERAVAFASQGATAQPSDARSTVSREPDGLRIDIPLPRMSPIGAFFGLIPLIVAIIVVPWLMNFFRRTNTPGAIGLVFLGLTIFFFGLLPATTVANAFRRARRGATIVFVSTRGIRIQERGAWRTRPKASLDASDILDVDYSTRESAAASARAAAEEQAMASTGANPAEVGRSAERLTAWLAQFATGHGLTVKTRTGLTTFGAGLADDEIRYLHSVVRRALHGRS